MVFSVITISINFNAVKIEAEGSAYKRSYTTDLGWGRKRLFGPSRWFRQTR